MRGLFAALKMLNDSIHALLVIYQKPIKRHNPKPACDKVRGC